MSKPHEINVDDLKRWMEEEEILYASSSRENKRLYLNFNGLYRVTVGGKTVHEGKDIDAAVQAYNDVTERYREPEKPPFTL